MSKSETPRTDKIVKAYSAGETSAVTLSDDLLPFTCDLEIELAEVKDHAAKLQGLLADARDALRSGGLIKPTLLLRYIDAALDE